jgi:hypothetical protein
MTAREGKAKNLRSTRNSDDRMTFGTNTLEVE